MLRLLFLLLLSVAVNAQTVYKTPSGAKYHLANCRMVKNVSEQITVEKAKELGLQPCKICNPAAIQKPGSPVPLKKPQGENITSQCLGYTKAGNRCKHMTSIGNGYCFQHQP